MKHNYENNCRLYKKINYYVRSPVKAKDLNGAEIEVCDTFAYNPESKTAGETAKRWAENHRSVWVDDKYVHEQSTPELIELDNQPFEVRLIDLVVRNEGGRAYKVIDSENRRFDLREDQLVDAIRLCGIEAGGKLLGKFVWGSFSSQTRLTLVGGELHNEMIKVAAQDAEIAKRKREGTSFSPTHLKRDHVYVMRNGSVYAFLGRVKTPMHDKPVCALVYISKWKKGVTSPWDVQATKHKTSTCKRSITLMASPVFVEELSDITGDGQVWRTNADGERHYKNGYDEDITVKWCESMRNTPTCTYSYCDTAYRREVDEWNKWCDGKRSEFRDAIVWL